MHLHMQAVWSYHANDKAGSSKVVFKSTVTCWRVRKSSGKEEKKRKKKKTRMSRAMNLKLYLHFVQVLFNSCTFQTIPAYKRSTSKQPNEMANETGAFPISFAILFNFIFW